jgi:hypothetical protein
VVLTGAVVVGAQREVPEVKSLGILWVEMWKTNIETRLLVVESVQFKEEVVVVVVVVEAGAGAIEHAN